MREQVSSESESSGYGGTSGVGSMAGVRRHAAGAPPYGRPDSPPLHPHLLERVYSSAECQQHYTTLTVAVPNNYRGFESEKGLAKLIYLG